MTKILLAMTAFACLGACQNTPRATGTTPPPGPRAIGNERDLHKALLDAEFRTLLEVQDSYRMMLLMSSSTSFGQHELVWTDKQNQIGDQLSVDIVGLLARYTLEKTVGAEDPVPMDPFLFGREVGKLADRRAALWLDLVESNNLPESARSIFHNGLYPARE